MEPTSSAGSLLIARLTAPQDIRAGDFIVFPKASQATPFTTRRVDVVVKEGERAVAFTKGDDNPVVDSEPLTLNRPVARVIRAIPLVGRFMTRGTVWRLWAVNALLGLRFALRWLGERRTTSAFTAHLRYGLWTRWLAEKRLGLPNSLRTVMR